MSRRAPGYARRGGVSARAVAQTERVCYDTRKSAEDTMAQARSTYRAVQAVSPGKLELTEKPLTDPNPGHVRIRVEACGVCHSDAGTVEGMFPIEWPRVPGHEAVGRIDAVGAGVEGWKVDQRVGVGFLGGSCGHCGRNGDLVSCQNQAQFRTQVFRIFIRDWGRKGLHL